MEQITKVSSVYDRRLLTVEGKTLDEWDKMTKEEREQTKSYKTLFDSLKEVNESEIAELEAELEDPDRVEGEKQVHKRENGSTWTSWEPWRCKGQSRERLADVKARNYEEETHSRLEQKIAELLKQSDDGHFYTITEPARYKRGFALMEENDWEYIYLRYYGGHDSGGIEEAELQCKGEDAFSLTPAWQLDEIVKQCPRILTWTTDTLFMTERGEGTELSRTHSCEVDTFFVKKGKPKYGGNLYWHNPVETLQTVVDNPISDAIDNEFYSWAGDWSADGTLVWDLRKEVNGEENPDYGKQPSLEYEISEYVQKTESIENSV